MPTVADAVARRLRQEGITHLFGVPGGGSNLDLIDAIERAGIRFVLTATETGGALAAIAQAEIAGRPGACLTTLGPGAASVVNGIACALLDRAPLLTFTDSHPVGSVCEHQRVDQGAVLAPVTKCSTTLAAATAEQQVAQAVGRAMTPPFGPIHLECPGAVLSGECPGQCDGAASPMTGALTERPASTSSEPLPHALAELVGRARKPLVIAGLGARRVEDARAVRGLCHRIGLPALVTYKAKGVVPDGDPWFGGVFTNGAIERELVAAADLLIGIGLDPVELIPRAWTYSAPVVSLAPWRMTESHVPFAVQHVGSVSEAVSMLESLLRRSSWSADEVRTAVAIQRQRVAIPVTGLSSQEVVAAAARRVAAVARVTVDAGAHMFPVTMGWPVVEPNGLLISNGLSTMGFALPAAIGAALLEPARPIVALTGDAGLLMCLAELATAVREQLPIVVLVFADQALSLIDIKQQQRALAQRGVQLGALSWPSIADGFGAASSSVATSRDLEDAIERALGRSGPAVIEAKIDATNYRQVLTAIRGS